MKSRFEILMEALLSGETININPESRAEAILKNIIEGRGTEGLTAPESRMESYLMALAEKMAGGGSDSAYNSQVDALIDRSITKISSKVTTISMYALQGCASLISADFPNVTKVSSSGMSSCSSIEKLDFPVLATINAHAFNGCSALKTLILRKSDGLCTLGSEDTSFRDTPIASKTGYIYVPSSLIEEYKVATNWSNYASRFRAIEDYPDICGSTE